jgi:hypothetical protein
MAVPSKALCQVRSGLPCGAGSNERAGLGKPKDLCVKGAALNKTKLKRQPMSCTMTRQNADPNKYQYAYGAGASCRMRWAR